MFASSVIDRDSLHKCIHQQCLSINRLSCPACCYCLSSAAQAEMAILDEIDSGLDIDALRDVASAVNGLKTPQRSALMVTHYRVSRCSHSSCCCCACRTLAPAQQQVCCVVCCPL